MSEITGQRPTELTREDFRQEWEAVFGPRSSWSFNMWGAFLEAWEDYEAERDLNAD